MPRIGRVKKIKDSLGRIYYYDKDEKRRLRRDEWEPFVRRSRINSFKRWALGSMRPSVISVALRAGITEQEAAQQIARWRVLREEAQQQGLEIPSFPTSP